MYTKLEDNELGSIHLPKYTDSQLRIKTKLRIGMLLTGSDYIEICRDIYDNYPSYLKVGKLNVIPQEIDEFIKSKYFISYSESLILEYLGKVYDQLTSKS